MNNTLVNTHNSNEYNNLINGSNKYDDLVTWWRTNK